MLELLSCNFASVIIKLRKAFLKYKLLDQMFYSKVQREMLLMYVLQYYLY